MHILLQIAHALFRILPKFFIVGCQVLLVIAEGDGFIGVVFVAATGQME
jgi:hypothetical protein